MKNHFFNILPPPKKNVFKWAPWTCLSIIRFIFQIFRVKTALESAIIECSKSFHSYYPFESDAKRKKPHENTNCLELDAILSQWLSIMMLIWHIFASFISKPKREKKNTKQRQSYEIIWCRLLIRVQSNNTSMCRCVLVVCVCWWVSTWILCFVLVFLASICHKLFASCAIAVSEQYTKQSRIHINSNSNQYTMLKDFVLLKHSNGRKVTTN